MRSELEFLRSQEVRQTKIRLPRSGYSLIPSPWELVGDIATRRPQSLHRIKICKGGAWAFALIYTSQGISLEKYGPKFPLHLRP